jgi:predicted O-methyltransferase YrrM
LPADHALHGERVKTIWRNRLGLGQLARQLTPSFVKNKIRFQKDSKQLDALQRVTCEIGNLRDSRDFSLSDIFGSPEINGLWLDSEKEIQQFSIPGGTGGVNQGDRRAIYHLISALKPQSVLEVGTHIGASTIHLASALRNNTDKNITMATVDILDVNSPTEQPWLEYGATYSPIEMVEKLGYGSFVEFKTDTSLNYAANCQRTFDFIFLDGYHSAKTVYQEIPVALKLLNPNGVILLHDYFPNMKPLWSNGSVIPGPYLATERLRSEGVGVTVAPLGELPWPTKLGSQVTSLALLLKNE